jgi:hypothetical protein
MSALTASVLYWPRSWFLVPYVGVVGTFLYGYYRWSGIRVDQHLRRPWAVGLVGAVVVSGVMVWGVLRNRLGRLLTAMVALAASLVVTAAYHWGFAEFRGPAIGQPLIGNALITLSYLLTTNPATPVTAHVAMHVAAVRHGMETAVQLPPHWRASPAASPWC